MESLPLSKEHLGQLQAFVELIQKQPSFLHHPDLAFFKSYLAKLGAKIPSQEKATEDSNESAEKEPEYEPAPESEESDLELDMTGVIGMLKINICKLQ